MKMSVLAPARGGGPGALDPQSDQENDTSRTGHRQWRMTMKMGVAAAACGGGPRCVRSITHHPSTEIGIETSASFCQDARIACVRTFRKRG